MTQASKPVEQTVAAIQSLDLEPIKLKLMDPEQGQGWSRDYADRMETAYKRYLVLLARFPEETIAPTEDVDKFWHGHILDTMKYAEDCDSTFGHFLHHSPSSGPHDLAGAAFHRLYQQEFGETLASEAAWCTAAKPAWCTAAKPAWCTAAKPAWCTAAKPAWCTAAKPLVKSGTAWCTAARPSQAA